MSHIDSYDHEFLGYLGYLPIYHPLEAFGQGIPWGDYDFGAGPGNLVLGGGSGEHPGLVVHRLECLAARFIYEQLSEEELASLEKGERELLSGLAFEDSARLFEFCDWRVSQYHALYEMAVKSAYTTLNEDQEVEEWLALSLGEFIYFSLPDLNPEHDKLLSIASRFRIDPLMENVRITPPGYPLDRGRRREADEVRWGVSRWQD